MAKQLVYLRGEAQWTKILDGQLSLNYNKDGKEWTMELVLDKEGIAQVKSLKIGDRIKEKDGKKFLRFKQAEYRKDGTTANDPIKVVDAAGNAWDQKTRIGNGSKVDVKFEVVDYGVGKKHGVYIRGVRVLDHVPYESQEFTPLSEDDEFFSKAVEAEQNRASEEDAAFREVFIGEDEEPDEDDDDILDDEVPI